MVPLAARQAPKSVPATLLLYTNLGILTNLSPLGSKMTHVRQCGTPSCVPATAALSCALLRPEAQPCHLPCHFFFLWYGRSRSKARSLHEKKLLVRKLLHGRRWSHAAWQIKTTKTQTKNTRQDADPPARFASHHQKDSKANSERGKSPTRKTTKDLPRHSGKSPLCRNKLKNMQQTN